MSRKNNDITIIKPRGKFVLINFKDLWRYKKLFFMFAKRDINVKYKQTIIGGLWAIIRPFLTMVIFSVVFGKMVKVPSDNIPYPIFAYSGILLWNYFQTTVGISSDSLVANKSLVSKIYFPRLLLPASSTLVGMLDYVIAGLILVALMFYYKFVPNFYILLVPVILFFTWVLTTGLGFWLSALNVTYRDTRYFVTFFTQFLMFLTPVIYPISLLGKYKWLIVLNPMTGFIEAHRSAILGHQPIDFKMLGISIAISIIVFITGLVYFNSVEKYFADVI